MTSLRAVAVGITVAVTRALLLAATAGAAAPPTRAEVETELKQEGNAGEAALPRLGATAEPILIAIADDRGVDGPVRARAVAALAYARTARAHIYLENLVLRKGTSSDATDKLLLRRATVALGWQSGPRVVDIVAPLLVHADAEVRLDAAVALGLSRAAKAEAPLRARLTDEQDLDVRRQIEIALRALAPKGPPP
jgi:HEAT repeat protein